MQELYKETMRSIINKQGEGVYKKLNLSPGFDVEDTVRRLGGQLEICNSGEIEAGADAKILPTYDGKNFKILYEQSEVDAHTRFSIAHELGHLFLHMTRLDQDKSEYVISGDYKHVPRSSSMIEWEAEEFAAAFLMPESIFKIKAEEVSANTTVQDKIQWLADLFKVPYKSVVIRGENLGIW